MSRVKGGVTANKTRNNLLEKVKGFRFGRSTKFRQAKDALLHAGNNAFTGRKDKKGDFRRLWTVKINGAVRAFDMSYSVFIDTLKKKNIGLNRKMLAEIAEHTPESFKRIMDQVKK